MSIELSDVQIVVLCDVDAIGSLQTRGIATPRAISISSDRRSGENGKG